MGSVFAMDHYQATFHTGKTGEKVSVVTSLYTVYVCCSYSTVPF